MKNFLAKLKGMNYKQVAVEHGEKGVLGLVGLFVLFCLAGTSWSRYDKEPQEFLTKVKQGEDNIRASAFTEDKKKELRSTRDIMDAVQALHSPFEAGRFLYSTDWFWPMYPQIERVREPDWLALKDPIIGSGKVIIVEQPVQPSDTTVAGVFEQPEDTAKRAAPSDDDDNAPRRPDNSDTAPRTVPGAAVAGPGANPRAARGAGANAYTPDPGAGTLSSAPGMPSGYGMPGMGSGGLMGQNVNARGVRFVSVRAVFPLKDQVEKLAAAMHKQATEVASLVEFIDFELERQTAQPGKNPWGGAWEKVDLQAALDILDRVDFDVEVVDTAYTDAVFTMPLPRRVAGFWNKYASHPLIRELTAEAAEAQQQLLERMVKDAEEKKLLDKTSPRGFASKQHDARGLRTAMGSMPGSSMMGLAKQTAQDIGGSGYTPYSGYGMGASVDPGAGTQLAGAVMSFGNQMQTTDARLSKYLLFRYLDFGVNPGNAYRYRVRLVLKNPNFGRPVEDLVDESVGVGETRTTPWSEPTPPAFVPEEQRIFLTKVNKARPDTGLPTASLDVFQWFADSGTNILVTLNGLQLGQFVGGREETEVVRPEQSLEKEEVPIFTGNVLADIAGAPIGELDPNEHADLKVDAKRLKQIGTVDKALLVDSYGQLVALDPKEAADEQSQAQRAIEIELKRWESLKGKGAALAATSDLDRLRGISAPGEGVGSAGMDPSMMMGMGMGMSGYGSSPIKKGPGGKAKKPPRGPKGGGAPSSSSGQP